MLVALISQHGMSWGGVPSPGGGDICSRRVPASGPGGVSQHAMGQTPLWTKSQTRVKQDCIPVGCIPPAHWPYLPAALLWGGGACSRAGGDCSEGGCLVPTGVCSGGVWSKGVAWSRGCLVPGGSAPGGVWSRGCLVQGDLLLGGCSGGAWSRGVCGIPACTEADTPHEQNDKQV